MAHNVAALEHLIDRFRAYINHLIALTEDHATKAPDKKCTFLSNRFSDYIVSVLFKQAKVQQSNVKLFTDILTILATQKYERCDLWL